MSAMTKSGQISKLSGIMQQQDEDFLSDDSQYASYLDNESLDQMDSSEDDEELEELENRFGGDMHKNSNNNHKLEVPLKTFGLRSMSKNGRKISTRSTVSSEENKVSRMPTRRPNPKIFNRNALMARENRKKKKEHLEMLEKDVDTLKKENSSLLKVLQKRNSMVTKLRNERLYLKSIIANKTSIMSLLKTIQGNTLPITSSNLNFVTENQEPNSPGTSPIHSTSSAQGSSPTQSTSSGYLNDEIDDLSTDCGAPTSSFDSQYSSELTLSGSQNMHLDTWENMLPNESVFRSHPDYIPRLSDAAISDDQLELDQLDHIFEGDHNTHNSRQSKVNHEHNYSNNNIYAQNGGKIASPELRNTLGQSGAVPQEQSLASSVDASDLPGICLHLSAGRVSLEFCNSCHRHSKDAWDEEF